MKRGRSLNLVNKALSSTSVPRTSGGGYKAECSYKTTQQGYTPDACDGIIANKDCTTSRRTSTETIQQDCAPDACDSIISTKDCTTSRRTSTKTIQRDCALDACDSIITTKSCTTSRRTNTENVEQDCVPNACDSIITTKDCTTSRRTSTSSCSSSTSSSSKSTTSVSDLFDSDDSVIDKDYVPPQCTGPRQLSETDSNSDNDFIENSQRKNVRISESPERDDSERDSREMPDLINLTKKGTLRKRKYYITSLDERKKAKITEKNNTQYCVKPGCGENCKKQCTANISESQREKLNRLFRKYTWKEQYIFINGNTCQTKPSRRIKQNNPDAKKIDRSKTVTYFLTKEDGEKVSVCKIFFLTTLGFNRINDKVLRNALNKASREEFDDQRGYNPNPKKIDNKVIIDHINSFNPVLSHYRREHAPLRKYLPSDINVRDMHKDFCEKMGITENSPPEQRVSYDHYRRVVKQLNISFAKLGNEQCEICEIYKIHNPNPDIRHRNCTECKVYEIHHKRYILAREKYNEDKMHQMNNKDSNSDTKYYSVDLEKVIMCPRLDEFKVAIFCPRLILFNESFVPLGDKKLCGTSTSDTFACIWHEAVSGRKKEDITSCFRAFFLHYRDVKHIVLWLDNCAAQNKNWSLFSYLMYLVNSNEVNVDTITLKYLEVGHTFMSADEFHHQVELSLKRKQRIYDFEDFHRAVSDTRRRITVKNMDVSDFHNFEDCSSAYKLTHVTPRAYLNKMCQATFQRGCTTITYKNDFDGTEIVLDFLRMKNIKIGIPKPVTKTQFRGITQERKSDIISKLVPLMPENRRGFWYNLPCNENSTNLFNEYEEL